MDLEEFLRSVSGTLTSAGKVLATDESVDELSWLDDEPAPVQAIASAPPPREADTHRSELPPKATESPKTTSPAQPQPVELDERLDEALWETFPASDPIAVSTAA